ncbi:hypothetical protein AKUA1805_TOXIN100140 (plasmid) [Apilactobacillus kunkeei]|nr:hypothetical protein AKUA1805_TOXIN100140 [Apilactobacillus kunkeei]
MNQVDWGLLYEKYHSGSYNLDNINERVQELYEDPDVTKKAGIFEYILGGEKDPKLLNIRAFSQTDINSNMLNKPIKQRKMEFLIVQLATLILNLIIQIPYGLRIKWKAIISFHGVRAVKTEKENLQMLCKHHNSMKSNN